MLVIPVTLVPLCATCIAPLIIIFFLPPLTALTLVRLAPLPSLFSSVPVASGSVIVLSVLVFGAVTVRIPVPEACP